MKRMEVVAGAENKHCSSAFISNEMNLLGAKIDDENTSFDSKVYSTKRLLLNIQKLRGVEKSEFEILDEFLEEILNVTSMNSMEKEKLLFNLSLSREQNHFQYKSLLQIEESKINKSRASFAMIESFDALVNASDPSTKNYLTKEFKFILKQLIDKETASSLSNVSGILTEYNILSSQNDHQKKCQKMSKGMANLTRKKEILVLFGSFSPITIAHLRNLEIARDTLRHRNFDVVKGIITPVSDAYKKKDLVSIQHRVNMIQGAIRGSNWLELDSYEGFLPYFSTSVTILRYLREKWQQEYEEAQVRLVCGSDLILSFNVPNLWSNDDMEEILRDFGPVIILRFGDEVEKIISSNPLFNKFRDNLVFCPNSVASDISSTQIRQLIRDDMSIKYLTPDFVIDYIAENKLYQL